MINIDENLVRDWKVLQKLQCMSLALLKVSAKGAGECEE